MYAIPILAFWIPLAGSAAVNSLNSYPSTNITNLETLIQNETRTNLRSKGPHCRQSLGTPPLHSCMEALSLVPKDRQQVTFGQRRSKGLVDHVMPFDLISSSPPFSRWFVCNPCRCRRRRLQSRSYHPRPTGICRRYDP
ncbi:hypothetical protein XPA_005731 [Xanthoria parietina]